MNVLITGGAGYIGGALVDLLEGNKQHSVHVYDSLMYEDTYRRKVAFTRGDVRDTAKLRPLMDWADVVVWLAAVVGDGACAVDPDTSRAVNTQSVHDTLAAYPNKRIIFMSTCSVYGAQLGVLTEESATNPLSIYAETKVESEKILAVRNNDALIFRLGTLFGVSDDFSRLRLDLVANTLVARAATQGKLTVFGGDQFRPLLHVRDVAKTIYENLATTHTGVFNLHSQNVRIKDLAFQVRNHFENAEVICTDMKFEDMRNYRVSSAKARRILGFKPVCTIDDGILQVKDIVENRLIDPNNPRYSNHGFLLQQTEQSK